MTVVELRKLLTLAPPNAEVVVEAGCSCTDVSSVFVSKDAKSPVVYLQPEEALLIQQDDVDDYDPDDDCPFCGRPVEHCICSGDAPDGYCDDDDT